jgi:hypothetical protein
VNETRPQAGRPHRSATLARRSQRWPSGASSGRAA